MSTTAISKVEAASHQKTSALAILAGRLNVDPSKLLSTLKSTVFKAASDDELLALVVVANEYNLNPLLKEIYAFPAKGGGIVPVVSIDGWVSMVNDHPQMDGMEFEAVEENGALKGMTCRIFRKDRSKPIEVTEWLSECKRPTEPWKMERRMLRHKALMQCARYAFGFSGVTDEDEAIETPGLRNITPTKKEEVAAKVEAIEAVEAPEIEQVEPEESPPPKPVKKAAPPEPEPAAEAPTDLF
jgi:phage recombination protein Bet